MITHKFAELKTAEVFAITMADLLAGTDHGVTKAAQLRINEYVCPAEEVARMEEDDASRTPAQRRKWAPIIRFAVTVSYELDGRTVLLFDLSHHRTEKAMKSQAVKFRAMLAELQAAELEEAPADDLPNVGTLEEVAPLFHPSTATESVFTPCPSMVTLNGTPRARLTLDEVFSELEQFDGTPTQPAARTLYPVAAIDDMVTNTLLSYTQALLNYWRATKGCKSDNLIYEHPTPDYISSALTQINELSTTTDPDADDFFNDPLAVFMTLDGRVMAVNEHSVLDFETAFENEDPRWEFNYYVRTWESVRADLIHANGGIAVMVYCAPDFKGLN